MFGRPTAVETLSAIIRDDPTPVGQLNPSVPAPVQWIVDRCLAKSPAERYGSTRDLARDLASARDHFSELTSSGAAAVSAAVPAARVRRRELVAWSLAAMLALAAVSLIVRRDGQPPAAPSPPVRFTVAPPEKTTTIDIAIRQISACQHRAEHRQARDVVLTWALMWTRIAM